jgi:peptidoglycan hydrolase-like protein with peptidoglycan-binding domain
MILRQGDKGNGVAIVQFALNNLTSFVPKLKTDGIFGIKTAERVRQHQQQKRLKPDGIVGPITLDTLFEIAQLTATAEFKENDRDQSTALGFQQTRQNVSSFPGSSFIPPFKPQSPSFPGGSFIPPFNPSQPLPPPNLLSSATAEFLRHQQAFWTWFAQPAPKPPMPELNAVVVPTPGPFGPVFLPVAHQTITLPGPPAKAASAKINFDTSGRSISLVIKGDASVDVAKWKFKEATYGIGMDWVVLNGRVAQMEVSPAFVRNNEGKIRGEVQVSLKGASGLTLKHKLGELGALKLLPYLATAVTTEFAIQGSLGFKAKAEINITKNGPFIMKAEIGIGGAMKLGYGPVEQPNGSVIHQITGSPFAGSGFLIFSGTF